MNTGTSVAEETKIRDWSKFSFKGLANQSKVGDLFLVLIYVMYVKMEINVSVLSI